MADWLHERGYSSRVVQPLASEEELQVVIRQVRHVLLLLHLHDWHVDLREALASTFAAELGKLRQPMQGSRARSIILATVSAVAIHASFFAFQGYHSPFAHPGWEKVLKA